MGMTDYMMDREVFGDSQALIRESARVAQGESDTKRRRRKLEEKYEDEEKYPDAELERRIEAYDRADKNLEGTKTWAEKHLQGLTTRNPVIEEEKEAAEYELNTRKNKRELKKGVRGVWNAIRGRGTSPADE